MPNATAYTGQFGAPLNPGRLRHQITWQRQAVSTQNSFGDDVSSWTDVITCRANVRSLSGRELSAAQQLWAEAKYLIEQHYIPRLSTEDRISWYIDGDVRLLDVIAIEDTVGTGMTHAVYAKDLT